MAEKNRHITQLAKLSFDHSIGRTHSWRVGNDLVQSHCFFAHARTHPHALPPQRLAALYAYVSREGDSGTVAIGEGSNVQDDAVLGSGDVSVGAGVTIGHGAIIKVCVGPEGAGVAISFGAFASWAGREGGRVKASPTGSFAIPVWGNLADPRFFNGPDLSPLLPVFTRRRLWHPDWLRNSETCVGDGSGYFRKWVDKYTP